MLRAILFDFNGVLVDDEPIHLQLCQQVLRGEGIQLGADTYYRRLLGLDDRSCFAVVLEAAGEAVAPERLEDLVARKAEAYCRLTAKQPAPFFPGALELVEEASTAGLALGVVSGALRAEIEHALARGGVRECFAAVVAAEDVGQGKPDPEGFRRGLEQLRQWLSSSGRELSSRQVVAVEDSRPGIEAARSAGLITVAAAHTFPGSSLTVADVVVEGLAELSLGRLERLVADAVGVREP